MIPIKQFLNKIKWSKKFNPEHITIHYLDRIQNKLIPLKYKNIKIKDNFIILENKQIPLHRIKEIRKQGVVIWKRSSS